MKYLEKYFEDYILDYVYYLVDKEEDGHKVMRVYCPNCGHTHTFSLCVNSPKPVEATIDVHFMPCECFRDFKKKVRFIHASKDEYNLNRDFVGEFSNEDGEAVWTGYVVYTSTMKSAYNVKGKTPLLERKPFIDATPVMKIKFKNDGTLDCRCAIRKYYYSILVDDLCEAKSRSYLRTTMFQYFETVGISMQELNGTHLERYIRDCEKISSQTLAELMSLHSIVAVRKLYDAGYKLLVSQIGEAKNIIITGVGYGYRINWECISLRSKTIEKILKIKPQQLDKICEREKLSAQELKAAQLLKKYGLEISAKNVQIAESTNTEALFGIIQNRKLNLSKTLKYLRNLQSKSISKGIDTVMKDEVSDYYDYLCNLIKLDIPLTNDVLYPSKFKAAHDRAYKAVTVKAEKIKQNKFKKNTELYRDVMFEAGEYLIRVIDSMEFLVKEAGKMHNCSAGYADRICTGEAVLFVIRKVSSPNKSFAMLQLSPSKKCIVQNRGINNCAVPQEVTDFANRWLMEKVMPFWAKQEKLKKVS